MRYARALPALALAAIALALPADRPAAAALLCSPNSLDWLQADTAGWIIAVATGDSAVAGRPDLPGWVDPQPVVRADTRVPIHGQWARVERSSDPRAVGTRVLVVRWNLGSLCEPVPSGQALGFPPGTRFFSGGSLRPDEGRGMTIHDITGFTPTYDARFWKADSAASWLTVDEYATFYAALPRKSQWFADPLTHTRALRAWARTHPSFPDRQPVLWALELMETEYAIRLDGWRDEGRWSRDSLIQEPGSLLRPGMRLLYRSDAEQLWTIDSLTRDTTLAGVPHCVRMRLRMSPQAPATTRAFCARDGVLHSHDASTGQLRPARPILPRQRLTVPGANRTTALFETDSLDVQMAGGRAFDLVFTTVTTRDSTGRVIRRLREAFAPALLTAVEGTFEVPDTTQAGGWRVVSRFRLAEIDP